MTEADAAVAEVQRAIVQLGLAQDYVGLQDYVLKSPEPAVVIIGAIWALLNDGVIRAAYLVAKILHLRGIVSPIISFALYFGGIEMNDSADVAAGKRLLREQHDKQSPETQHTAYYALEPLILQQISLAFADGTEFTPAILRLLDFLKQIVPDFRTRFDLEAPTVPFDIAKVRARGHASARLRPQFSPPEDSLRRPRRALVAFREKVFPHFINSRLLEQGPTMVAALNNYGWNARFHGFNFNKQEIQDAERLAARCLEEKPDVLILDAVLYNFPRPLQVLTEMRRALPDMKIVALYFDAWSVRLKQLKTTISLTDLIWTVSPDFEPWKEPEFAGKVAHLVLPRGGDYGGPILPLQPRIFFGGGVAAYNWHRALWIAAARQEGLPLDTNLNAFFDDKLPPLESYQAFMRRLADGRCAINFSMRQDMKTFPVTGRSFEIVAAGALLVQETSPEMDCYFIAGEHYLPFSSFAELRGVVDFLREQPEEAERIRRAGNAFYRARYHDDLLIGHLDNALYGAKPA